MRQRTDGGGCTRAVSTLRLSAVSEWPQRVFLAAGSGSLRLGRIPGQHHQETGLGLNPNSSSTMKRLRLRRRSNFWLSTSLI